MKQLIGKEVMVECDFDDDEGNPYIEIGICTGIEDGFIQLRPTQRDIPLDKYPDPISYFNLRFVRSVTLWEVVEDVTGREDEMGRPFKVLPLRAPRDD